MMPLFLPSRGMALYRGTCCMHWQNLELEAECCSQADVPQPPAEEVSAMRDMMIRQAAVMEKHTQRQRAQQAALADEHAQQAKVG